MQPLFANKRGLITGVFNKQSIAWAIAEQILNEGGECGFSYMPDKPDDERKKNLGRVSKLTEGNPQVKFLQPMDVTNDEHIAELMNVAKEQARPARFPAALDRLRPAGRFETRHDRNQPGRLQAGDGDQRVQPDRAGQRRAAASHRRREHSDAHVFRRRAGRAGLQRDGHLQGGARFDREVSGVRSGRRAAFASTR